MYLFLDPLCKKPDYRLLIDKEPCDEANVKHYLVDERADKVNETTL